MEAKPTIPFADLISIGKIGERIRTQDNCATENPIYQIRRTGELGHECVVAQAFTQAGVNDYLMFSGHNIRGKKFVHVDTLRRNHEMIAIRNFLKSREYDHLLELERAVGEFAGRETILAILESIESARAEQRKANE